MYVLPEVLPYFRTLKDIVNVQDRISISYKFIDLFLSTTALPTTLYTHTYNYTCMCKTLYDSTTRTAVALREQQYRRCTLYFRTFKVLSYEDILSYFRMEIDTFVRKYESTSVRCTTVQRCTFEGSSTRTSFRRCTAVHVYCTVYSTTLFQPITSGKCSDTVQRVAVPNPAPCPLSKKSSKGRTTISQPRCA